MKIHTGDIVTVIAGKDKGKQGTVVRVLAEKNRVVVEGINMRVRHIKKTPQQAGQRISYEASIHASNVMIIDPKTKKPTRIGYLIDEKTGAKKRIAKASGEVIVKAVTKAEKKTAKKGSKGTDGTKVTEAKAEEKKTEKAAKPADSAAPKKQPFWKRKEEGGKDDKGAGGPGEGGGTSFTTAHRSQGG